MIWETLSFGSCKNETPPTPSFFTPTMSEDMACSCESSDHRPCRYCLLSVLEPLRAIGYFVELLSNVGTHLRIRTTLYQTDHDEEAGTVNYLELHDTQEEGECAACNGNNSSEYKRGCINCPLCHKYTKPWALIPRRSEALIQMSTSGPKVLEGHAYHDILDALQKICPT